MRTLSQSQMNAVKGGQTYISSMMMVYSVLSLTLTQRLKH